MSQMAMLLLVCCTIQDQYLDSVSLDWRTCVDYKLSVLSVNYHAHRLLTLGATCPCQSIGTLLKGLLRLLRDGGGSGSRCKLFRSGDVEVKWCWGQVMVYKDEAEPMSALAACVLSTNSDNTSIDYKSSVSYQSILIHVLKRQVLLSNQSSCCRAFALLSERWWWLKSKSNLLLGQTKLAFYTTLK